MPRIIILGSSGSGKSTLSSNLSRILSIPHIELDALNFNPGFVPSPELLPRVLEAATCNPSWIIDGNYRKVQVEIEPLVTHVIFLDLPFYLTLYRLVKRTFWRWWSGHLLWGKCRETVSSVFAWNNDGLFYYMIKYFWKKRAELTEKTRRMAKEGKTVWTFQKFSQVEQFMERIETRKLVFE